MIDPLRVDARHRGRRGPRLRELQEGRGQWRGPVQLLDRGLVRRELAEGAIALAHPAEDRKEEEGVRQCRCDQQPKRVMPAQVMVLVGDDRGELLVAQLPQRSLAQINARAQVTSAESLWVLPLGHATGDSFDDDLLVAHPQAGEVAAAGAQLPARRPNAQRKHSERQHGDAEPQKGRGATGAQPAVARVGDLRSRGKRETRL
jgi:hypothetical protein